METAVAGFHKQIAAAMPIVEKYRMPLGIENHKDWRVDEQVALLRQYSSEYLGVSLDTGNNLTVLDDPMDVVEKLAPYTFNVHLKDMAARGMRARVSLVRGSARRGHARHQGDGGRRRAREGRRCTSRSR